MTATRKRDLRTGRSIWQARRLPSIPTRPLRRDLETEVLIVGAGISGALVAEALTEAKVAVTLVDRRGPVQGSTAASTSLLLYEIDTPLSHLARQIGRADAERVWRRSRLALDALRERTRRLGIAAEMENRDSLYLQGDLLDAGGLEAEAAARRRAGFEVEYLDRGAVAARYGIAGRAALLGFDSCAGDPRRLTAGYLRQAAARGARIYAPVEVSEVEPGPRRVLAATKDGPVIRARYLVYATGYEIPKGVPTPGHKVTSTWALATRPQPRKLWPTRCFVWEASEPYLYLRAGPQGRVICGGEDEEFADEASRDALLPAKTTTLEAKLGRLLPRLDPRADYAWTGSFGTSDTGTPSIGPVPGMPSCFAVLGYGGNGITFSMVAAQMLRAMIAGDGDPDVDLFAFDRRR